jgi:hypothetical protein
LESIGVDGRILLKCFFNDGIKDVDWIELAYKERLLALVNP